jgi:hypothetical protein
MIHVLISEIQNSGTNTITVATPATIPIVATIQITIIIPATILRK